MTKKPPQPQRPPVPPLERKDRGPSTIYDNVRDRAGRIDPIYKMPAAPPMPPKPTRKD